MPVIVQQGKQHIYIPLLSSFNHIFIEWPIFLKYADALIARTRNAFAHRNGENRTEEELVDVFNHAHKSLAEAMTIIIFGQVSPFMPVDCVGRHTQRFKFKQFVNERNLRIVEHMAMAIAELTGIYQNTSYFARTFPSVWRIITV